MFSPSLDLSDNLKKMRDLARALLLLTTSLDAVVGLSVYGCGSISNAVVPLCHARVSPLRLQAAGDDDSASPTTAASAAPENSLADEASWWKEEDATPAAATPPAVPTPAPVQEAAAPPQTMLQPSDLENTRWDVKATPREDSWLTGGPRDQEFTLLSDETVVWGGSAGGFGTGGRWKLQDGILEVIRTTPLGLVTGRDYYMAQARVQVDDGLKFELNGIIRSYNALYPVMVIADFVATRRPGRFVREADDE